MSRSILKKSSQIGILTLFSRCLAFAREFLLIRFLGLGAQSDAFFMAFRVPNTMRKIFAEGALSSVLVPALVKIDKERGRDGANRLMTLSFLFVETLLLLFCLWVFFNARTVFSIIAPGFNEQQIIYGVQFLKILVSFILFISSSAVLAAALQSKNKFLIPAVAPAFLNIFYVGSLLVCMKLGLSVNTFCACMVSASVVACIMHFIVYFKNNFSFYMPDRESLRSFGVMLWNFIPYVISLSIVEVNFMIDLRFTSFLPPGSISMIRYAFRFIGIPLGVLVASFATVLLTHFARIGSENEEELSFNLFEAIKFIVWTIVPIIFVMGLFSQEIFSTLYSNGPEMVEKVMKTRAIFLVFLGGLISFSLNRILLNVFYALQMAAMPFYVSILSVVMNYFMNQKLMLLYGAPGIAAASALAATVQMLIYVFYLYFVFGLHFDRVAFYKFISRSVQQWLPFFAGFYAIYRVLRLGVSKIAIDTNFLWFRINTDFFLNSFGLWIWAGPLVAGFALALYRSRKWFKIRLYFLDK